MKPNWSRLRLMLVPLAAVGIAIGLDLSQSPQTLPALAAAEWNRPGYGPADFDASRLAISQQMDLAQERVANGPHDWLREETLARAYMARSRFSVTYDDLAAATNVIEKAQADAPPGSGPLLSAAAIAMLAHQLGPTEHALDTIDKWAVAADPGEQVEVFGLRGDIAFYRGDMIAAKEWYDRAAQIGSGPGPAFRRANLSKAQGDFAGAIAQFRASAQGPERATPLQLASTALQIGAVEQARGNYPEARRWFALANRDYPGFWLFEAHAAQSLAVGGDLPGAIAAMRKIATASPSAEVMDALAMLLRASGNTEESRRWATRAQDEWARRLALAPEAAYGHALEHELVFGTPARALELARLNVAARPYGDSRILLASALTMNGRYAEALAELARAKRSGWRSAPLYALEAQLFEITGKPAEAKEARARAGALNPKIFAPETALVWFAHG